MSRKIRIVGATTHIDAHNQRITREALVQSAKDISTGEKPMLTLMHDMTIPPFGKMLTATVEPRDDGEYQLVIEGEIFDEAVWTNVQGVKLFKQESDTDASPFVDGYKETSSDRYEIAVDGMNFESYDAVSSFMQQLKEETGVDFVESDFGRKSAIPDPEIIITLAQTVTAYVLGKKVIDTIAENVVDRISTEVGNDIAEFYSFVTSTIRTYLGYIRAGNRPITYIFVLKGQPNVEFVAQTIDANLVLSATNLDRMRDAIAKATPTISMFDAAKSQFLLSDAGEWEFNYLLTKSGGIIGTEKAHGRRSRVLEISFPSLPQTEVEQDLEASST